MRTNTLIFVLLVLSVSLTGCAKHFFRSEPEVAGKAAEAVAKNLNFNFKRSGDSDTVEVKLSDSDGYTIGFLRLTPSPHQGFATRVQSEFLMNSFMPKNMLRGFYLECMEQQMQLDSGSRNPHTNRRKSFYEYQFGNLLSPSISTYYAVNGNPFYYPYARYPAIATQGIMEFGAIMTAIGYFDADTRGQRKEYLNAFLFYYGISRGIGMILGLNLKYYEKVQALPYDLSAMSFSF